MEAAMSTEPMNTAVSVEALEMDLLTDGREALRRVATLVARGTSAEGVFGAVAAEVGDLFGSDVSAIIRFEADGTATVLGDVGGPHEPGTRVTLRRGSVVVEGELWGAIAAVSLHRPLSPTAERRLTEFTELLATAVANTEAREQASGLAEEQAALLHVAELVAHESSAAEVFSAVTAEAWRVLGHKAVGLLRFERDGTATLLAQSDTPWDPPPVGTSLALDGENVIAEVHRTGRAARADDWADATGEISAMATGLGVRSAVATPIVVAGRLWGTLIAATGSSERLPRDTERRMERFAGLVATAIANAEARDEVKRLAEEQAALRRVATLVAEGASPDALFEAVAVEMEWLLGADAVSLARYEPDAGITELVQRGCDVPPSAPGAGVSVRAPIVVQGRLWGVAVTGWKPGTAPPADAERRMGNFTQLLATAVANADSLEQLRASRGRLVTADDAARRRVVRDLHDGAQQRLVHAIVTLKLATEALDADPDEARALVAEALGHVEHGNAELRELAHGILPPVLTNGGLGAGVDALADRLDLPVRVDVSPERFGPEVEANAYFIVAEALTNVVKHAHASVAEVKAYIKDDVLHVEVRDDGIGSADPQGHGLVGLADRATALSGRLAVDTPPGGGTRVAVTLPLSGGR
jgi:signal transduction histidine kinase